MASGTERSDWKHDGVRVVRVGELDGNTPQTPGMVTASCPVATLELRNAEIGMWTSADWLALGHTIE